MDPILELILLNQRLTMWHVMGSVAHSIMEARTQQAIVKAQADAADREYRLQLELHNQITASAS